MKQKSIAVNTVLNSIRMTLTILIPLITYPYITRIFNSDGIGQYEWVKSVISILTLFASLGINTYAVREGSKIRNDRKKFTKFAQELFIINFISTFICYMVLIGLISAVPKFNQYQTYLLIYSINIGLSALSLDWVYGVYEDYAYITIRQIIVQLISLCGLFLLVKNENDLIIYIIITTVSNSGANIFNFIRARKYVDFKPVWDYSLKLHIVPVLIFFGTRFAMHAYNSLDTFVLGIMCDDRSVGYYNVAVKINTILVTFFSAMSPVYLPRMIKYISQKNDGSFNDLLKKAIKLKTMLVYPMVCGLFCFAPQIVWLLAGDDFSSAVVTLRILSFVLGFVIMSNIVQNDILIPKGREKIVFGLTIASSVLNVLISCLLIAFIGYNGAAVGSLIAEGLIFILGTILVLKKENINLIKIVSLETFRYIISSLVMSAVCIIIKQIIIDNILSVLVGIPCGVVVYFSLLFVLNDKFFRENFIKIIKKILKKDSSIKGEGH